MMASALILRVQIHTRFLCSRKKNCCAASWDDREMMVPVFFYFSIEQVATLATSERENMQHKN